MMNKIYLHLWLFTLGSLIFHACTQSEVIPDVEYQEYEVKFQANEVSSRSLIEENLSTTGTEIKIYGYHDNDFLAEKESDKILNGRYLHRFSDALWAVLNDEDSPITYYWEGYGRYRFFGWLTHDAAHDKDIPFTPTYSAGKLTIPATVVDNRDVNQFDFLYSDINHRIMTADNFFREQTQPVVMNMNHLLSAFAIGIRNTSEDAITVKKVSLNCIHDKGSAVIDFNQTVSTEATSSIAPIVQYGTTSKSTEYPFMVFSGSHTLLNKTGYAPNVFAPSSAFKQFYMVWPQDGDVLNASSLTFDDEEAEAAAPDEIFPIVLEYTVGGKQIKKRMRLPNNDWMPGKKYYLELQVADKLVNLTTTVSEWDYTDSKVDFSNNSISVKDNGHLQWDLATCTKDDSKKEVYVTNGAPVEGTFTIDAPQGGQWRVSLEGDVTAFKIADDTAPTDDGFGPIDGKEHRIRIVPTIATPDRDYKVTLKFVAITADHKTYPADDMIQDSNGDDKADIYTVVLRSVK